MATPWFETVRVKHPNIPNSEHDVPKDSLIFMERAGWVLAYAQPETDSADKPEDVTAEQQEMAKQEAEKPSKAETSTTSSRRSATKKDEG